MHNAALACLAKEDKRYEDWRYVKFDIEPERLEEALPALRGAGFIGLNLTVPHKILALGLIGSATPGARAIGAVNALVATEEGWEGHNTDSFGLCEGLRSSLGLPLKGAEVLLLGAGGAARSAAVECLLQGVRSLSIVNRSPAPLEALLEQLRPLVPEGSELSGFSGTVDPQALPAGVIVINATSLGLRPGDPAPIDLTRLKRPVAVFDMVYNPPKTQLLAQAATLGLPAANGLSMLVHQGAKALSLWTGAPLVQLLPPMRAALTV